jgi:nitrate reductase assembly molybdenum cofactor insertion protein NarJ
VAYPDDEFVATLPHLDSAALIPEPARHLLERARRDGVESLRARWIELFDSGKKRVPLYETEFGRMRGMSKGHDLADLAGFYRAFGVALDPSAHEMLDHLSIELEFYATLLAKEAVLIEDDDGDGIGIVSRARRAFLSDHLGAFAPAVASRLESEDVYGPLLAACAAAVAAECEGFGIEPSPLEYHLDGRVEDDACCGAGAPPISLGRASARDP